MEGSNMKQMLFRRDRFLGVVFFCLTAAFFGYADAALNPTDCKLYSQSSESSGIAGNRVRYFLAYELD